MSSAILCQYARLNVYQSVFIKSPTRMTVKCTLLWYTLTLCTHTQHTIECTTPVVYLDFMYTRTHARTLTHTHTHTNTYNTTHMHTHTNTYTIH